MAENQQFFRPAGPGGSSSSTELVYRDGDFFAPTATQKVLHELQPVQMQQQQQNTRQQQQLAYCGTGDQIPVWAANGNGGFVGGNVFVGGGVGAVAGGGEAVGKGPESSDAHSLN